MARPAPVPLSLRILVPLVLVAGASGTLIHPAAADPGCWARNYDSSLVTDPYVDGGDAGDAPDGSTRRRFKVDATMQVNERHCVYWLTVPLRLYDVKTQKYVYDPNKTAFEWVESTNPNGMAPQQHGIHPIWLVDYGSGIKTQMTGGAVSTHEKGHNYDADTRYAGGCWVVLPSYILGDLDCNPETDSPLPTTANLVSSTGSPCESILRTLASSEPGHPVTPGNATSTDLTAGIESATYSVPDGLTVVSVEAHPPTPSCPIAITAINLDDGTVMWVGPGLSEEWNYNSLTGEVLVDFCGGIFQPPCTFASRSATQLSEAT